MLSFFSSPEGTRNSVPGMWRIALVIIGVSAFIVCVDNTAFWSMVSGVSEADEHRIGILANMFFILFGTLNIVLAMVPSKILLKTAAAALLITSALVGYYMTNYGVLVDATMVRNVIDTDMTEASPLITSGFLLHMLVFGFAPAVFVARLNLGQFHWWRGVIVRSVVVFASIGATLVVGYLNFKPVAFFAQEHRESRLFMNPAYPIYSYIQFLVESNETAQVTVVKIDDQAHVAPGLTSKPRLVVMVVGETARADRFSTNGYQRNTNAFTKEQDLITFSNVSSCGTSTADSIPCMFSPLGRQEFSHTAAAEEETLLAMFNRLGIDAYWRDNNTGCKGQCDPANSDSFSAATDNPFCSSTGCFDEALLSNLPDLLANSEQDHLMVLHQRGSHGPAYFQSTPDWAKQFQPECDLPNLRDCSLEALNNAYDNTILYTDFVLAEVISQLESMSETYDVAMLYASDHGESLGEGGLYLHGFPYGLAPTEQTHIPMLFWASESFYQHSGMSKECLRNHAAATYSHDNMFHTLTGMFNIQVASYQKELDFLAICKGTPILSTALSANTPN